MNRLFISQPMNGRTNEEIRTERERIIEDMRREWYVDEPFEVVDSFFENAPVGASPLWYLGESIKLLSTATLAYFAYGWEDARGCRIEHLCAEEYGIPCIAEVE